MLLQRVGSVAAPCLALLAENECAHPVMRERRRFLLEAIPGLERCDDPDPMLAAILENTHVQGGGTAKDWPSPEIYKDVKDQLEVVRSAIKKAREQLAWNESATREAAELGLRFARLASKARRAYDEAKRARGGLDFDDLLIKTRDLLRDHAAAVRDAPHGALQRVLVDEFQDTDPIQGEILERLSGEAFPSGRLFLVGDAKQSIYRFRGRGREIFEEFRDRFPEAGRLVLDRELPERAGHPRLRQRALRRHVRGPRRGTDPRRRPGPRPRSARRRVPLGRPSPRRLRNPPRARPTTAASSRPAGWPGGSGSGSTRAGWSATARRGRSARHTPATSPSCSAP